MPIDRRTDEERAARINQLMEEHRRTKSGKAANARAKARTSNRPVKAKSKGNRPPKKRSA